MSDLRFVFLTMDGGHHSALHEAVRLLYEDYGVRVHLSLHSAAILRDEAAWARLERDIARADFIFGSMIFGEDYVRPLERILSTASAPMCFITSNPALIYKTRLGKFILQPKAEGEEKGLVQRFMQKLRPKHDSKSEVHRQTSLVKNLTRMMKYVPGKMRDLHSFVSAHGFWLHSSPVNLERMMCLFIERYVPGYSGRLPVLDPVEYPDLALYHPDAPAPFPDIDSYTRWRRSRGLPTADGGSGARGVVGLLTMRAVVLSGNTPHLDRLIHSLEAQGIEARATYSALLDFRPAIDAFFRPGATGALAPVDVVVNTMGFPLVGGPAGARPDQATETLQSLDVGYIDLLPLGFQCVEDWQADEIGLNPMQVAMNIALPELDSSAEPTIYGGPSAVSGHFVALEPELNLAARRIARRVHLRHTSNADKKIAVVLFNFPPNLGNAGTAAYLDVFASLHRLLHELQDAGYTVDLPTDADSLRTQVVEGNAMLYGTDGNVGARLALDDYRRLFPWYTDIERYWGAAPGELLTDGRDFYILGRQFGNVFVAMQPSFGYERDPMRLLMGKDASPHHGFAAFYTWLDQVYEADAVLHFGTHGALEFMPGKQTGLSANCWPARLLGGLPNFYYYCVNNPSEGSIAKRRGAATLVSYMVPPVQQAGLYKGLRQLKDNLDSYHKRPDDRLLSDIRAQADKLGLGVGEAESDAAAYIAALGYELIQVEQRMIPLGLHVLGRAPSDAELVDILALVAAFNPAGHPNRRDKLPTLPAMIAHGLGWDYSELARTLKTDPTAQERWTKVEAVLHEALARFVAAPRRPKLDTGEVDAYLKTLAGIPVGLLVNLWQMLDDLMYRIVHDGEVDGLLHSLEGGYILPSPGNDVVRNQGIAPTGRNIHALDPYRVPRPASTAAANELVRQMLDRLTREQGSLPETVAMVLWGTDNLKSDGEGIAQCFALLGVRAVEDELGHVSDVALIPLAELGRPRIDVVMTVSGIFRDLFHHQVGLLDKAVRLAAEADEPVEQNFVRKHTLVHAQALGVTPGEAAARVFSNAPGSYGANVNHLVESSAWDGDDQLSETFLARKSFAYGPSRQWSEARPVMERALATVDAAFQNVDSFELGISDVDHYYEYLGGVTKSVEKVRGSRPPVMVADAIALDNRLTSLEQMVRLESRAKLLNPKWYDSMLAHGYEGVREIELRVSNTYGWSATASAVEDWVYDDIAGTFLLDDAMRARLAQANPHATAGIARRLLEANARGFWEATDDLIDRLREIYGSLEDQLEGVYTA